MRKSVEKSRIETFFFFFFQLENLKILSLGRNLIKNLVGLVSLSFFLFLIEFVTDFCSLIIEEAVADTLEELWISYNQIEKLKGIGGMKKLRVLYMSNNAVKEWPEFQKLVRFSFRTFFFVIESFLGRITDASRISFHWKSFTREIFRR